MDFTPTRWADIDEEMDGTYVAAVLEFGKDILIPPNWGSDTDSSDNESTSDNEAAHPPRPALDTGSSSSVPLALPTPRPPLLRPIGASPSVPLPHSSFSPSDWKGAWSHSAASAAYAHWYSPDRWRWGSRSRRQQAAGWRDLGGYTPNHGTGMNQKENARKKAQKAKKKAARPAAQTGKNPRANAAACILPGAAEAQKTKRKFSCIYGANDPDI